MLRGASLGSDGYESIVVTVHLKQKFALKNKKDLGMACHTPPLKKVKKQGEMPLPSLGLSHFKKR